MTAISIKNAYPYAHAYEIIDANPGEKYFISAPEMEVEEKREHPMIPGSYGTVTVAGETVWVSLVHSHAAARMGPLAEIGTDLVHRILDKNMPELMEMEPIFKFLRRNNNVMTGHFLMCLVSGIYGIEVTTIPEGLDIYYWYHPTVKLPGEKIAPDAQETGLGGLIEHVSHHQVGPYEVKFHGLNIHAHLQLGHFFDLEEYVRARIPFRILSSTLTVDRATGEVILSVGTTTISQISSRTLEQQGPVTDIEATLWLSRGFRPIIHNNSVIQIDKHAIRDKIHFYAHHDMHLVSYNGGVRIVLHGCTGSFSGIFKSLEIYESNLEIRTESHLRGDIDIRSRKTLTDDNKTLLWVPPLVRGGIHVGHGVNVAEDWDTYEILDAEPDDRYVMFWGHLSNAIPAVNPRIPGSHLYADVGQRRLWKCKGDVHSLGLACRSDHKQTTYTYITPALLQGLEPLIEYMRGKRATISGSFAAKIAAKVHGITTDFAPGDIDVFIEPTARADVPTMPGAIGIRGQTSPIIEISQYDIQLGNLESDDVNFARGIVSAEIGDHKIQYIITTDPNASAEPLRLFKYAETVSDAMDFTIISSTISVLPNGRIILAARGLDDLKRKILRPSFSGASTKESRIKKWVARGFQKCPEFEIEIRAIRDENMLTEHHSFKKNEHIVLNGGWHKIYGSHDITVISKNPDTCVQFVGCTGTFKGKAHTFGAVGSNMDIEFDKKSLANIFLGVDMQEHKFWMPELMRNGVDVSPSIYVKDFEKQEFLRKTVESEDFLENKIKCPLRDAPFGSVTELFNRKVKIEKPTGPPAMITTADEAIPVARAAPPRKTMLERALDILGIETPEERMEAEARSRARPQTMRERATATLLRQSRTPPTAQQPDPRFTNLLEETHGSGTATFLPADVSITTPAELGRSRANVRRQARAAAASDDELELPVLPHFSPREATRGRRYEDVSDDENAPLLGAGVAAIRGARAVPGSKRPAN
jgi:hypothetical protein